MLLYVYLYVGVSQWAHHTIFEDVQEIQPWCRITATTSQSHDELSTNVPFYKRRVKVEGGGVALSRLQLRYHALVFAMDVSQWLGFIISSGGAHSLWPCSVNILEHSGCSGVSPGTLYINDIILYIDIYITLYILSRPKAVCGVPDHIMNLKRLRRVLPRLGFFHINLK
jgi:hypothetical protein